MFHRSLFDSYHHLGFLVWTTICWWMCLLPIITAGPATAAMFTVFKQKRENKMVRPADFWQAFKDNWRTGIKLQLVYILITFPGVIYSITLIRSELFLPMLAGMVLIYLLFMWHLIYLYAFPVYIEQGQSSLKIVLLRSFKLVSENFGFTINMSLYIVAVTLVCSLFTIALTIWAGILTVMIQNSVLHLLHQYEPEKYSFSSEVSWSGTLRPWKT